MILNRDTEAFNPNMMLSAPTYELITRIPRAKYKILLDFSQQHH